MIILSNLLSSNMSTRAWGKQIVAKKSTYFEGTSIFGWIKNSVYGTYLSVIKKLTENSIDKYKLPKVICIGNESSGKSSLIENIVKCPCFPRAQAQCTKCPIIFRLATGPNYCSISYFDHNSKERVEAILKDITEIYAEVSRIFSFYPANVVYEEELIITIRGPDTPNFEFYDLPGIRTYPEDLAEKTVAISKKYLCDKDSIVICVVPATTPRLSSCQSIALVIQTEMQKNCILALTMADRLQPENIEEFLVKRILGTSDEVVGLGFAGYNAIVNRTHTDSKSLKENDDYEIGWFNENIMQPINAEYGKMVGQIEKAITISRLLKNIDDLYNKFINTEWKPRVIENIRCDIKALEDQITDLGPSELTMNEFQKDLAAFFKSNIEHTLLRKIITNPLTQSADVVPHYDVYRECQAIIDTFGEEVYSKGIVVTPSLSKTLQDNIIRKFSREFCVREYSPKRFNKFIEAKNTVVRHITSYNASKGIKKTKNIVSNYLGNLYIIHANCTPAHIKTKLEECFDLYVASDLISSCYTFLLNEDARVFKESEQFLKLRGELNSRLDSLKNDLQLVSNI